MPDDITITAGANSTPPDGTVVATDEVAGKHYQRVKLDLGADGASDPQTGSVSVDDAGGSLTVDGSVGVSGTVAVTQSGTWDEVGINDSGNSITVDNPTISVVGGGTEATAQRVTIANDSTGVVSVDDNGGSLTVDGSVTIGAGTANIGDVDVLSIAAGDNNIGNVDIVSVPAPLSTTGGGTEATALRVTVANDSTGVVSVDDNGSSLTVDGTVTANAGTNLNTSALALEAGGNLAAAATSLGVIDDIVKAEDAPHSTGDSGVMSLAVRQSTQADFGADGDYVPFSVDDDGGLRVSIVAGAGSGGTAAADDADFTAGTTQGTPAMGVYESTPSSVTDGDLGTVGITTDRRLKTSTVITGDVDVASVIPGTGATNLGKAVDSVPGATDTGVAALAVRDDALTALTPVDGDYTNLRVTSTGALWVSPVGAGGQQITVGASGEVSVNIVGLEIGEGTLPITAASLPLPTGASTSANQTTIIGHLDGVEGLLTTIDADTGGILTSVQTLDNAISGSEMQVDVVAALPAGDNNIGNVDIVTVPAPLSTTGGGTEATALRVTIANDSTGVLSIDDNGGAITVDGTVTANLAAGTNNIGDVDVLTLPNVTLAAGTNTNEVVGDAAEDAALAGNPVRVGMRASTAIPTAMSGDGDVVTPWANRSGAQVMTQAPHVGLNADPWSLVHEAAQYTTTQTSAVLVAGGASEKLVVTKVQIQVGGTTAGTLQLYFGTGAYSRGTNRAIFDGEFAPSATLKPGVVMDGPFIAGTNGDDLLVTTSAAINPLTISVWYYVVT